MSNSPSAIAQKSSAPVGDEDQLETDLLADGILDQAPSPIAETATYRLWQPIPWEGKPVSESILEERR